MQSQQLQRLSPPRDLRAQQTSARHRSGSFPGSVDRGRRARKTCGSRCVACPFDCASCGCSTNHHRRKYSDHAPRSEALRLRGIPLLSPGVAFPSVVGACLESLGRSGLRHDVCPCGRCSILRFWGCLFRSLLVMGEHRRRLCDLRGEDYRLSKDRWT